MKARVFISCGQREDERRAIAPIVEWFDGAGFRPYVALEAQSLQDVTSGVIAELRRSDYYVFVDFRRESLRTAGEGDARGSLFSHQELAIAYAMGFEHTLFFRERGVAVEGIAGLIASNARVFDDRKNLTSLLVDAVQRRRWRPGYSRNLVVGPLHLSSELIRYRELGGRFLYGEVHNRRPDAGARGCVARLAALSIAGGPRRVSPNRSHLKVTGHTAAYEQTIWPESQGAFDLACIDLQHGSRVFLNNALDVAPEPLFDVAGEHMLEYEVFAEGFDIVPFTVCIRTTANCYEASAELCSMG